MAANSIDFAIVFAEFIGTLIYGYGAATSKSEAFAVAGSLYIAMGFTGYISTPQFNPAVTLSIILRKVFQKDFEAQDIWQYLLNIIAQFSAAFLAALMAWLTCHHTFYYNTQPSFNNTEAFFAEMAYTAVISATCLTVKKVTHSLLLSGVAISAAYLTGCLAVGSISLGCFNPALGFSFNLVRYIIEGDHFTDTWIYILAPLLGALVGTVVAVIFLNIDEEDITINRTMSLEGKIAN